jgi:hypothetical protein
MLNCRRYQMLCAVFEKNAEEDLDVFESCHGCMFFGVPHQGLHNTALKEMTQGSLNEDLIRSLILNDQGQVPEILESLDNAFVKAMENRYGNKSRARIACYYEDQPTRTAKVCLYITVTNTLSGFNRQVERWRQMGGNGRTPSYDGNQSIGQSAQTRLRSPAIPCRPFHPRQVQRPPARL